MSKQTPELEKDNTYAKEALLCEIGQKLKQSREEKALSKEQVLKELKLNSTFLEALESGDWSQMPGEVYAIGFLRQYAQLLELDFSTEIQRIKTNSYELTVPLTYPDAPISPNRTWVFTAVLLFILIIIISNLFESADDQDGINHSHQVVQNTEPAVVTEDSYSAVDSSENTAPEASVEKVVINDLPAEAVTTVSIEESKESSETAMIHSYTFTAVSAEVWLQIFRNVEDGEPELLREALLAMGDNFSIESDEPLLLTSGKPTALSIHKDGEILFEAGQLGEENRVLKRFPL